jgi:geranylgeranyl diphosphate synthase type I
MNHPDAQLDSAVQTGGVTFDSLLSRFRDRFEIELRAWIEAKHRQATEEVETAAEVSGVLQEFLHRGGKRLRPALLFHAYIGCGGESEPTVMPAAMAMELLHTYLLIHDDIMDHAEMRRGDWAAHILYRDSHRAKNWQGDAEHFGASAAILLGDLAYTLAAELINEVDVLLAQRQPFHSCFSTMCREVILGQYLELTAPNRTELSEADLLKVLQMKSGRYSVERPIQLGAILAGAGEDVLRQLSAYGLKMGEAFQLQDDLLGVFGDAGMVGKPVESDLAEGKRTLLVFHTLRAATRVEKDVINAALGKPHLTHEEIEKVREIMERTGARRHILEMIEERLTGARAVLEKLVLSEEAGVFFHGLVDNLRGREQ